MMVRLEDIENLIAKIISKAFQFHDGAIGSISQSLSMVFVSNFNSMMVRLEDGSDKSVSNYIFYFNSMMVRLEDSGQRLFGLPKVHFNSMMVRLEVPCHFGGFRQKSYFNSMMVRLEVLF